MEDNQEILRGIRLWNLKTRLWGAMRLETDLLDKVLDTRSTLTPKNVDFANTHFPVSGPYNPDDLKLRKGVQGVIPKAIQAKLAQNKKRSADQASLSTKYQNAKKKLKTFASTISDQETKKKALALLAQLE